MTESQDQASAAALTAMKLPQLQKVASELGLKGISRLRKGELIEAIRTHGEAKAQSEPQRRETSPRGEDRKTEERKAAPQRRESERGARGSGQDRARKADGQAPKEESGNKRQERPAGGQRDPGAARGGRQQRSDGGTGRRSEPKAGAEKSLDVLAEFEPESKQDAAKVASLDDIQLPKADEDEAQNGGDRRRRGRDRRDRKRRPAQRETQNYDDVEVTDADVLIPIAGVLDVLDNYAFVRTTGYLPGSSDVYVNLGMVRRYGLRRGDAVTGAVKQPREGESSSRQKFNALVVPELVNNAAATEVDERPEFEALTATYPRTPVALGEENLSQKSVDVLAPLALGQRVLISADQGADRLGFLKDLAQGIAGSHPNVHLMMVLIDERPEDATAMQRGIHGEVISSSFDRSGGDHTTVATLAVDRAKRLVELGQDVIVVLDSLTALARAYHTSTSPSSRVLEHGLDASTIHALKQLFGAGRSIENGGSLTLIATGVKGTEAGEFLLEELRAVANAHIDLAPGHLAPTITPQHTYTRDLEAIFDIEELAPRLVLRRLLSEREDGAQWLADELKSKTAGQFLTESVRVTPREKAEIRRSIA